MSNRRDHLVAFAAGMMCANSLPHLATAVTGRRFLTPLGGRMSSPGINAVWGAVNLVAGLALARRAGPAQSRWDSRLVAFDAGAAAFAGWMVASESVLKVNWSASDSPG